MPDDDRLASISHRRFNPLKGSWILVSPHRTKRPWQGQQEKASESTLPEYDSSCYLCPGNKRAQGDQNPDYSSTFVFVNDYSAVRVDQADYSSADTSEGLASQLLRAEGVRGLCYVLTFSPAHNLTLADLAKSQITAIIEAWTQVYCSHLSSGSPLFENAKKAVSTVATKLDLPPKPADAQFTYMQIFENKGAAMGCSNPHPHGQIWCTTGLPDEVQTELCHLVKYRVENSGRHMLSDYVELELSKGERTICENDSFIALCPWWATWPFEVMIISKEHRRAITDLTAQEREQLAHVIGRVTRMYDNLFETHFPYSMGLHQAPLESSAEVTEASHLHIHFYPPLLRSATVRKFLVGYEMMAEPQRDITPEQAATRLRTCDGEIYRSKLQDRASADVVSPLQPHPD